MRLALFPSFGLCLLLVSCGGNTTPITDCTDGTDNDADGLIDELDPGCPLNGGLAEAPDPKQCTDGLDNDGDGLVDLADYGCEDPSDDEEQDPTRACNDGVDNDGDGDVDFGEGGDIGCDSPVDDDEFNPAECSDFLDNDGDGVIDYPFEPGCISEEDVDEVDPIPPPACADGMDNDGDEYVDYPTDPGCSAAADDDEYHFIAGECGPSLEIVNLTGINMDTGSITGPLPNELDSPECHGFGGEHAYSYTVGTSGGPKALVVSTDFPETTLDTVLYVRTECRIPESELACDDDGGVLPRTSKLIVPDAPPGLYYVIVDAYGPGSLGNFKVTIEERNGLHGPCSPANPTDCVPGLICQPLMPGSPNTCEYPRCMDTIDNDGDTLIDYPFEPGCDSPTDNNEVDPPIPPQCANGIDDDGDGFIDFTGGDPGCDAASDGAEIDECVPGAPVIDHPGGPITGTTAGGSSVLGAPGTCGGTTTATTPERVYFFDFTNDLSSLTFATTSASFDSVVYVRAGDCSVAGTTAMCNDGAGNTSAVTLVDPAPGGYYAIVDGKSSMTGTFTLSVTGVIDLGGTCVAGDVNFVCEAGTHCGTTGTCVPAQCNDGIDNDADGAIDYPFDWGCDNISDDTELATGTPPECANGIDDDLDGFIDYPADDSCSAAVDDDESCLVFDTSTSGYSGCSDVMPPIPPCPDLATTPGALTSCVTDDCVTPGIALGFTFTYFGVARTTVDIGSNGKIGWGVSTVYSNTCTIEANTIAVYWDDLYPPTGGSIRYLSMGTAPNRTFNVQWNVPHISGSGGLYDLRAVLHETTNDITVCYIDTVTGGTGLSDGASATTGIRGALAGDSVDYSCNMPIVTSGLLLRYLAP